MPTSKKKKRNNITTWDLSEHSASCREQSCGTPQGVACHKTNNGDILFPKNGVPCCSTLFVPINFSSSSPSYEVCMVTYKWDLEAQTGVWLAWAICLWSGTAKNPLGKSASNTQQHNWLAPTGSTSKLAWRVVTNKGDMCSLFQVETLWALGNGKCAIL